METKNVAKKVGQGLKFAFLPDVRSAVNVEGIKAGHGLVNGALDALRVKRSVRVETFADAVERLELTEDDIARKRRELLIEARISYVMTCLFLAIAFYNTLAGAGALVLIGSALSCTFPVVLSIVKTFRIDQIDRRELYSFPEFFRRPEAWLK